MGGRTAASRGNGGKAVNKREESQQQATNGGSRRNSEMSEGERGKGDED